MGDDSLIVYSLRQKILAYAVHFYTALGLLCGAVIAADIFKENYRDAFAWMIIAVLIDATDGTFARKFRVKEVVPHIDGRKLDDIVDYLNYTFLPLLMVGRAGWLPEPAWLWVSVPLVASVFAFVNTGAKEEANGFFLGFPSYWNIFAFYTAVYFYRWGSGGVLALVLVLSVLSVVPLRFVYPNRAPRWRRFFVLGGLVWLAILLIILWQYPAPASPNALLILSAVYPVFYLAASVYLDCREREVRASQRHHFGVDRDVRTSVASGLRSSASDDSQPLG
jgi:phosphatidylcholine synthase